MTNNKLKRLLKDPILLLTLFAMIASTLISFLLVNRNYHKINMLESQVRDKKIMIRELLDSVNQQYTQVSVLVLLDFMTEKSDEKTQLVRKKYFDVLPNLDQESTAIDILEEFEKERKNKFERIDNLYIEEVYLEKQQNELEQKNKIYSAIATLLQIIGLALIIVRKDFSLDNLY